MTRPRAFDQAYPQALWEHERRFLAARRGHGMAADRPPDDAVGVALSGGGIRSATFCLGVFQALAQHQLLSRIDYLSTVSGGGYFGSFLGRLYTRDQVRNPADVEGLLAPNREDPARRGGRGPSGALPDVVSWLRENGRYLSPNGAGDLLLGGAIMLRNWVAIHVVLLSFFLLAFLTAQGIRVGVEAAARRPDGGSALGFCGWFLCGPHWVWWSPFLIVPLVLLVLTVVPTAWAYWLTGNWQGKAWYERPAAGVVTAAVVALGLVLTGRRLVGTVGLVVIGVTAIAWWTARSRARSRGRAKKREGAELSSDEEERIFEIEEQRNRLSNWLKVALVATGGTLAFAVIDSLGQTTYLVAHRPDSNVVTYLGTALGALAGVAAFARRIATGVGGKTDGKRLRLPLSIVAAAVALIVVGVPLLVVNVVSHGVAWRWEAPSSAPRLSWLSPPDGDLTDKAVPTGGARGGVGAATSAAGAPPAAAPTMCSPVSAPCSRGWRAAGTVGLIWLVVGAFCLLFGRIWLFVNNSSLQSMYSARLTRAYLGASNPLRQKPGNETVTRVLPGDNTDPVHYWPAPPADQPDPKQPPLHLINVTINETMDGRSQVQQRDRKGVGLSIGPCAMSVGVRHHAVFPSHADLRRNPGSVQVFPAGAQVPGQAEPYRVFAFPPGQWGGGEPMTIGAWVGISGAAFSTGMGSRTSLGVSLLCGFGNVRLGYWWDSAAGRNVSPGGSRILRAIERAFPVQVYLLSEFLSRFHGTSRARWFLSDGGHFENTGGYEMIRRRLARILLVDAEADPQYTFEGLANLVRKARLDFGAEITFLTAEELDDAVAPSHRYLFGSLDQLRRGHWSEEPVDDARTGSARRSIDDPIDETRHSLAHAALARVTFLDEPARVAWLVYLKPTLTGDESADLTQYHRTHPSFPQETTADQFFDEAQWESYRMLGFLIARGVFGEGRASGAPLPPEAKTPRAILFEA